MRLDTIHLLLKDYISEQEELHHIDRDINSWQFNKLSELADQLDDIICYEPTFKDAVMAIRVLQKTINIRNQTEEDFDVSEDDIKHCHFAIECILEDINYDCYLDNS